MTNQTETTEKPAAVDGWAKALSIQAAADAQKAVETVRNNKRCEQCGKILPISEFRFHPRTEDRLIGVCNSCMGARISRGREAAKSKGQKTKAEWYETGDAAKPVAADGRPPRELIEQIKANVETLRSMGWTCNVSLSYPKTIHV